MSHSPPSATCLPGRPIGESRVLRPAAFLDRAPEGDATVAVLVTGCRDVTAAVRGYKTVLPRARIVFYGDDLGACVAAAAAGAEVRHTAEGGRDAFVRRLFADIEADIYLLAHGATAEDACVAPLAVAEVEGGKDFVDIGRFTDAPHRDLADRLLCRAVDFAFGGWGDILDSDLRACSRRFALSYRRTVAPGNGRGASARDLALHALRLRLPIGRVATLAGPAAPAPARTAADWVERAGIVARLLVEERPRRVFGLLGLALVLSGLAVAAPRLTVYRWHMAFLPGARTLATTALMAAGGVAGAAGLLLDALASARQEVRRLGAAAIPRRAEPPRPASDAAGLPVRRAHSA